MKRAHVVVVGRPLASVVVVTAVVAVSVSISVAGSSRSVVAVEVLSELDEEELDELLVNDVPVLVATPVDQIVDLRKQG